MINDPGQADPPRQDAPAHPVNDPAIRRWFLTAADRGNPASDLRAFSTGNSVLPLVDGREYFARLCAELVATQAGDEVYFADFRGDLDERLAGPGTEAGRVLCAAAARGVKVFGLLWRSQPRWLRQSEEENAEFAREITGSGGHVLLDARTRRGGSHHQKLVVIRRRADPAADVAFVGGIDLGHSRGDDGRHDGDPQRMDFPAVYGDRPAWHDIQAEVRGPAVHDLEHTFRERWYGSSVLDVPSPLRMLYDRAYHAGAMTGRPLPDPVPDHDDRPGTMAVQVLRTYPARLRRYPFAPLGERSIARAYQLAFARARQLVYLEDQYLWSAPVAAVISAALRGNPRLRVVVVVPRHPDHEGRVKQTPELLARAETVRRCAAAGPGRFAVYDRENDAGLPVYVHAKVVVIDDTWAMIGSDNLNRRSWTHDSELSIAVLDAAVDERDPRDPGGAGDQARVFARELRLRLWREHLGLGPDDTAGLLDPVTAFDTFAAGAQALATWYTSGRRGPRPPARVRAHHPVPVRRADRLWAAPAYRLVYDPDGRPLRQRFHRR